MLLSFSAAKGYVAFMTIIVAKLCLKVKMEGTEDQNALSHLKKWFSISLLGKTISEVNRE